MKFLLFILILATSAFAEEVSISYTNSTQNALMLRVAFWSSTPESGLIPTGEVTNWTLVQAGRTHKLDGSWIPLNNWQIRLEMQTFTSYKLGSSFMVDLDAADIDPSGIIAEVDIWNYDVLHPSSTANLVVDQNDIQTQLLGQPPTADGAKTQWWDDNEELTGMLFREGVDKIVGAISPSTEASAGASVLPDWPSSISLDTYAIDLGTTPDDLSSAVSALASKIQTEAGSLPDLTSGLPAGNPKISFTFPSLNIMGTATDSVVIEIDPAEYSGPIGVARGLLASLLAISFYFSLLSLVRSAFADAHTINWLSKALRE